MNIDDYVQAMMDLLKSFKKSNKNYQGYNDFYDWNHALDNYMMDNQEEFCPTCNGEGYCEEQLDVDDFKPYPCPDCIVEQEIEESMIPDEYRDWAGIEE